MPDHNNIITSDYLEGLIVKLLAVRKWEDNYTLCQDAAAALQMLMDGNTIIQGGNE